MKKFLAVIWALFFITFAAGIASANLIKNGDFENGLQYWESEDVSIVTIGAPWGNVALLDDNNSVGDAWLSQSFYISPGTTALNISFDYLFTGTDTKWVDDYVKSNLSYRIGDEECHFLGWSWTKEVWNDEAYFNIASSASTFGTIINFSAVIDISSELNDINPNGNIKFTLIEKPCNDTELYLDNVNIAPVPEPATIILFGTGIAGLGLAGRKKLIKKS